MSRNLSSDVATEVGKAVVSPIILFEGDFDSGTLRLWSGIGEIDWNGNTFTGGGTMLGISPYSETEDLQSQGLTFMLSGVPTDLIAAALEEQYQGRACRLYLGFINRQFGTAQVVDLESGDGAEELEGGGSVDLESGAVDATEIISSPYLLFSGIMDVMEIADDGKSASLRLNAENAIFLLTQAKQRNYTSEDQKAEFPGDLGMDFIPSLQDKEVLWQAKN